MSQRSHQDAQDLIDVAALQYLAHEVKTMDHPAIDELVAFQEGRLPEDQLPAVRQHLSLCAECAQDVLDLAVFDQPPARQLPEDSENERSWQTFQQRLAARQPRAAERQDRASATRKPAPGARDWRLSWPSWPGQRLLLAASLLLAMSGVAAWWAAAPLHNPYPFFLRPQGEAQLRASSQTQVVEIPATADALVPTLWIGDSTRHPGYRAELRTADGRVVFAHRELLRQQDGSFTLLIPAAKVPPGAYDLDLFAAGNGPDPEQLLATYSFEISVRDAPDF